MDIDHLMLAQAKAAKLDQKNKPARVIGEGNREIHREAFPEAPTQAEKMVRIDDVVRDQMKLKMIAAVDGRTEVPASLLEVNPKDVGFKRPKVIKKRKSVTRVTGVRTEKIMVNGVLVEVQVKTLQAGNDYYVGKSTPSGQAPWGTKDTPEASEARDLRRFEGYLEKRVESAQEAESNGRQRKGGGSGEYQEALDHLMEAEEEGVRIGELPEEGEIGTAESNGELKQAVYRMKKRDM